MKQQILILKKLEQENIQQICFINDFIHLNHC